MERAIKYIIILFTLALSVSYADENCVDCRISANKWTDIQTLNKSLVQVECALRPLVTTTVIKENAFNKGITNVLNRNKSILENKVIDLPAKRIEKSLYIPDFIGPDLLTTLASLASSTYGFFAKKNYDETDLANVDKICSKQTTDFPKLCSVMNELIVANKLEDLAQSIQKGGEDFYRKCVDGVKQIGKSCQMITFKNPACKLSQMGNLSCEAGKEVSIFVKDKVLEADVAIKSKVNQLIDEGKKLASRLINPVTRSISSSQSSQLSLQKQHTVILDQIKVERFKLGHISSSNKGAKSDKIYSFLTSVNDLSITGFLTIKKAGENYLGPISFRLFKKAYSSPLYIRTSFQLQKKHNKTELSFYNPWSGTNIQLDRFDLEVLGANGTDNIKFKELAETISHNVLGTNNEFLNAQINQRIASELSPRIQSLLGKVQSNDFVIKHTLPLVEDRIVLTYYDKNIRNSITPLVQSLNTKSELVKPEDLEQQFDVLKNHTRKAIKKYYEYKRRFEDKKDPKDAYVANSMLETLSETKKALEVLNQKYGEMFPELKQGSLTNSLLKLVYNTNRFDINQKLISEINSLENSHIIDNDEYQNSLIQAQSQYRIDRRDGNVYLSTITCPSGGKNESTQQVELNLDPPVQGQDFTFALNENALNDYIQFIWKERLKDDYFDASLYDGDVWLYKIIADLPKVLGHNFKLSSPPHLQILSGNKLKVSLKAQDENSETPYNIDLKFSIPKQTTGEDNQDGLQLKMDKIEFSKEYSGIEKGIEMPLRIAGNILKVPYNELFLNLVTPAKSIYDLARGDSTTFGVQNLAEHDPLGIIDYKKGLKLQTYQGQIRVSGQFK